MAKTNLNNITPSATPSDEDIRCWQALPRDEQLARMKLAMKQAAEGPPSTRSMQDIKQEALQKIATREKRSQG